MATEIINGIPSTRFSLTARDFLKGAIISIGTSVLVVVQNSMSADTITFNWKQIGMAAVAGFVTYLTKNYFTNDVKVAQTTLTNVAAKSTDLQVENMVAPINEAKKN